MWFNFAYSLRGAVKAKSFIYIFLSGGLSQLQSIVLNVAREPRKNRRCHQYATRHAPFGVYGWQDAIESDRLIGYLSPPLTHENACAFYASAVFGRLAIGVNLARDGRAKRATYQVTPTSKT